MPEHRLSVNDMVKEKYGNLWWVEYHRGRYSLYAMPFFVDGTLDSMNGGPVDPDCTGLPIPNGWRNDFSSVAEAWACWELL